MSDRIQPLEHRLSSYIRPTQDWQCGRVKACAQGPDLEGRCCQRDQPCVPTRSVRSIKRQAILLLVIGVIGGLAVFLSSARMLEYLSPGPLSLSHAEVAGCQDCHAGAGDSVGDWLHAAVASSSAGDDEKCLSCHKLGENAFSPHSVLAAELTASRTIPADGNAADKSNWKVSLAGRFRDIQHQSDESVSCSNCHREHQGRLQPLDSFNPQKCHTCHQIKFDEIESSHPEYTGFPHQRPTRIQFDHVAHLEKYFLEEENFDLAPEGCNQCHRPDQSGEWMLAASFEESCSACHLSEVLGENRASAKGIAVLTIPELDTESLAAAGHNIGEWPTWADGELAPIMRVLLPPEVQSSLALTSQQLDLYDLSEASEQELASVAALAWSIKGLLYDMQTRGTEMINQRIAQAFNNTLDQSTLNRLIASLPRDTLVNNQQQWFPELMQEITDYRSGKLSPRANKKTQSPPVSKQQNNTAEPDSSIDSAEFEALFSDEAELAEQDIFADEDAIEFDEQALFDEDSADLASEALNDDFFDDVPEVGDLFAEDDEPPPASDSAEQSADIAAPLNDNEQWALSGGWYRDGSTIRYRPVDHADPFFKTWLDVSSQQYSAVDSNLFDSLSAEQAVGNCVKCHTIETVRDTGAATMSYQMHWQSFKPEDVKLDFNRFSHVSHFSLMTDDGCASCHSLNINEVEVEAIEGTRQDSTPVPGSFLNMERSTCTQCHQEGRAPDNCLTCHNYHAEPHNRLANRFLPEQANIGEIEEVVVSKNGEGNDE